MGKVFRRACVVSEPLSQYQRWAHSTMSPLVEAGEDIRWVPRGLLSSTLLSGNDFYLIDGMTVVFTHYSGEGATKEITTSINAADVARCRAAFDAVWPLAIPHGTYEGHQDE